MQRMALCIFLVFCLLRASAQGEDYQAPRGLNNWYVEMAGSALFYSVNYEKYLYRNQQENLTWVARVGIGFNPIEYNFLELVHLEKSSFMVPFTTTILKGAGKEKLELGGGFTMLTKDFLKREIVPGLVLGLRVMESNRVCFRISYTPLLRDGNVIHWMGVSLGKNFNFK